MALTPGLHVLNSASIHKDQLIKSIVCIQASCILVDRTMATFIPPLSYQKMLDRWTKFLHETDSGSRIILGWLAKVSSRDPKLSDTCRAPFEDDWPVLGDGLEVSGVVSLSMPASETGPFRGLVQNLFVHPLHRHQGVAKRLLAELEQQALSNGRWNLMLDTTVGTPAEKMYAALGWNCLGVVKDYGYRPSENGDGAELADEIWFWKDLRKTRSE